MSDPAHPPSPPQPASAPPPPIGLGWLFFGLDGRIGREVYWLGIGFVWSVVLATVMALGGDVEEAAPGPVFWVVILASQWVELALLVKRLHDRDLPGFWALLKFLPFVGVMWIVLAGLMRGDPGPNSYAPGPDERGVPPVPPAPPAGGQGTT